jgi:glutamyl-tRNA reductase
LTVNTRFLIIGAGETNRNIAQYLKKHKYADFSVFNRTFENAQKLADELGGKAYSLADLESFSKGFDVIIVCTSSTTPIVTLPVYQNLLNGEEGKKIVLDLAVPNNLSAEVLQNFPINYIQVETLKETARKNIQERYDELINAEHIIDENIKEFVSVLRQRRVEIAMSDVPRKIKEIKETAINGVFADDINSLDENSRAILERVMDYMEKKYISVPMVIAKEVLVNTAKVI